MSLILDPATEQHLQQELATGRYRDLDDLIAQGLKLVQAEREDSSAAQSALAQKLQRGYDQASRGELYSPEEARAILAQRRAARAA